MNRYVACTTSFEGIHCWPSAPKEVMYLRFPHRHIFRVSVKVGVEHNDREIEFIMLKHYVDRWIGLQLDENGVYQMLSSSCEDVADEIISWVAKKYPGRKISVSVFEDGENGCTIDNG